MPMSQGTSPTVSRAGSCASDTRSESNTSDSSWYFVFIIGVVINFCVFIFVVVIINAIIIDILNFIICVSFRGHFSTTRRQPIIVMIMA